MAILDENGDASRLILRLCFQGNCRFSFFFKAYSQNYEKRVLASTCHVCLSVRPHGTARFSLDAFS